MTLIIQRRQSAEAKESPIDAPEANPKTAVESQNSVSVNRRRTAISRANCLSIPEWAMM